MIVSIPSAMARPRYIGAISQRLANKPRSKRFSMEDFSDILTPGANEKGRNLAARPLIVGCAKAHRN